MSDKEIWVKYIGNKIRTNSDDSSDLDIEGEVDKILALASDDLTYFSKTMRMDRAISNVMKEGHVISKPSDSERKKIIKELETKFNVSMGRGFFILGDNQRRRKDKTWWSLKRKNEVENYYWNRYQVQLQEKSSIPLKVIQTIDKDTDSIMDNLEDPANSEFNIRGMVVGHVQSGKTGNYAALICKAADAGYKVIVVIAGATKDLRNQTQGRLNEGFVGMEGATQVGVGLGSRRTPISLTTPDSDFNKGDADKYIQLLGSTKAPIFLVVKKNSSILKNLIKWLKSQSQHSLSEESILVIDDESDYASINTKEDEDPSKINERIRDLLEIFKKRSYVAYTATPFANIFINHEASHEDKGDDLFPRDFILALKTPDDYLGPREIFIPPDLEHDTEVSGSAYSKFICDIDDNEQELPIRHERDLEIKSLPASLKEAIGTFFINIAVRNLRGQVGEHNSMMVNVTWLTDIHEKVAHKIKEHLGDLSKEFNIYDRSEYAGSQNKAITGLQEIFNSKYQEVEFSWGEVLGELVKFAETVIVREIHMRTLERLEYRKDRPINVIVVGGLSLSRGFTLEGLSVSYFIRNTNFYDTLMQMGRWFGYRVGYEDLVKIYSPSEIVNKFIYVIRAMDALYEEFMEMHKQGKTPLDFGLAVQRHPDSLLHITALNKQKNVKEFDHSMCLDGELVETRILMLKETIRNSNIKIVKTILEDLGGSKAPSRPYSRGEDISSYLWESIDKSIVIEFLKNFTVSPSVRMPLPFVRKYADKVDTTWDVALYSGAGNAWEYGDIVINKEIRTFDETRNGGLGEIRGVSSVSGGSSESISLTHHEDYNNIREDRKKTRKYLARPLLMLHIIQPKNKKGEDLAFSEIAAFGISFPKEKIKSGYQNIRLAGNKVYQQLEMQDVADDQDD